MPSLSEAEIKRRCPLTPESVELMNDFYSSKINTIIVMGHVGNWELANYAFNLHCKNDLYAIYKPLSNDYFDLLIRKLRSRWGTNVISIDDVTEVMNKYEMTGNATGFIADQRPAPENAYWTIFLNQETPVFRGTEILARRLGYPVVYLSTKRIKRGYYQVHIETLIEQPKSTQKDEISEIHTRRLEQDIIEQPEAWLWTHRRWRDKIPESKSKIQIPNK